MRLHIHRWKYLSKESYTKNFQKRSTYGYGMSHSTTEETELPVTTIRWYCTRCTNIKFQTVDGTLKSPDVATLVGLEKE